MVSCTRTRADRASDRVHHLACAASCKPDRCRWGCGCGCSRVGAAQADWSVVHDAHDQRGRRTVGADHPRRPRHGTEHQPSWFRYSGGELVRVRCRPSVHSHISARRGKSHEGKSGGVAASGMPAHTKYTYGVSVLASRGGIRGGNQAAWRAIDRKLSAERRLASLASLTSVPTRSQPQPTSDQFLQCLLKT